VNEEIRRQNAARNLDEYRQGAAVLTTLPRYVLVELTQGCNLACPMCRSGRISPRERGMTRELVDEVADTLFPTAELVDIRGWGESLIAEGVEHLIDRVETSGARTRVVTNLSFNRPAILERLVHSGAMVDVSIDSAEPDVLRTVRIGTKFDLVKKNLRNLVRLRDATGSNAEFRFVVTLQRQTLAGLADLVRFAGEVGVRELALNEVTLNPGHPMRIDDIPDEVDRAVEAAQQAAAVAGVRLQAGSSLGTRVPVEKGTNGGPGYCVHPWSYATIGYDGVVGYCDHLVGPMMPVAHMGTFSPDAFMEVWNGPAWQRLRVWHTVRHSADKPVSPTCAKCYLHRNVDFEDVFEPGLKRTWVTLPEGTGAATSH
jgi:MoaA/NifB/PqqE/SkfB family radical SAM enzyme